MLGSAEERGISPIKGFSCSPLPGGLYWTIVMTIVGYASTLSTFVNFALHRAFWSSAVLLVITLNGIRLQMFFMTSIKRLQWNIATTLRTGFLQPSLRQWLEIPICSKHAITVFIMAFTNLLVDGSFVSSAMQVGSYLLSVWTVICTDVDAHMGGDMCQAGRALVKQAEYGWLKSMLLLFWSGCHVAGSIASTALIMKVWHPVLGIALFVPGGWVKLAELDVPWWKKIIIFFSEPIEVLTFSTSSVFGFPLFVTGVMQYLDVPPNLGNVRAWPLVVANTFRLSVSAALLAQYIADFLHAHMFQDKLFEAVIVAQVLILVPLDIIAMVILTATNRSWRAGIQNEEAANAMLEIARSLIVWEDEDEE